MTKKADPTSILRYVSDDLSFRASVVDATVAVREMQSLQNTFPIATNAVGRTMVAALLMASNLKDHQMVSLYFRGDGPLEMFFAEATYEGEVRGYTPNPQLELKGPEDQLNLGKAIGKGLLTVVRSVPQQKLPQRGSVEIQTGEVGDDLAFYYYQSHQIPSVVSLGVKVNPYGMVQGAGGILIELLPDAPETVINQLEKNMAKVKSLSEMIASGTPLDQIAHLYFDGFKVTRLEHSSVVTYSCRCTKERLVHAIELLGPLDISEMLARGEDPKARCEMCGRQYTLSQGELTELYNRLKASSAH